MNYKIIDNFLQKDVLISFQNLLMSTTLPWYWRENMTKDDNFFFNYCFYNNHAPTSVFFNEFITPMLIKLKCNAPIEVRANLMLKKNICYNSNFHIDKNFNCKTAIFYVNTNNGYTILDKIKKIRIDSIENRMLVFDSKILHAAFSQTDTERRIVVNFNYF